MKNAYLRFFKKYTMKKIICAFVLIISCFSFATAQNYNIQLASNYVYSGGVALANIGGYVDSLGNEYALVGTSQGLSIMDVSVPAVPIQRFLVPGPISDWREVKTYRHFAYVTTEGGGGLTVIDLNDLPGNVSYHQYTGDGIIAGQLDVIHSLHCDTATGYLYLYGSNINSGVPLFLNLNLDPYNPQYAGRYIYPTGGNIAYVHDGYVQNDTAYFCHVFGGFFSVVDVSNKANPVLLTTQSTPGSFTHNCWLSDDHHTLFTTDEIPNSNLTAYDVTNLTNIDELSRFKTDPGSNSIVHNTHILNDYAVTSWYTEGVVIVDVARPRNPIEVGKYDTYPASNSGNFNGDWGVYPYLPSGNLVVSDIDNGLFILTPTYVRGCYLEGVVIDSLTGTALNGVMIQVLTANNSSRISDISGGYRTGTAVAGNYNVQFSKTGYYSKTISGVSLANGILTLLNVQLVCINCVSLSGQVIETGTNNPVSGATVVLNSASGPQVLTSDGTGNFSVPNLVTGSYDIVAGEWGYRTTCLNQTLNSGSSPLIIALDKGYYDDFSLDFGWTASSLATNNWVRAVPVATTDNGATANPGADVNTDCINYCYVTDNGGGGPFAHDVDPADGKVTLTSPVFDLSTYAHPELHYYRWFYDANNTNGSPNDTMVVLLTNGITTVTLETLTPSSTGNGTWLYKSWNVMNHLTANNNMQLIVRIWDASPGNVVEGGFDKFEVVDAGVGISETAASVTSLDVFPNPAKGIAEVTYHVKDFNNARILVSDIAGREVELIPLKGSEGKIFIGEKFKAGIYFITLLDDNKNKQVLKLVKTE